MDFGSLLHVAQKNEKQPKKEIKYYSTKFEPPKKEERSTKQLSDNIKKFLARKESEEKKKALEAQVKREELLALRSQDRKATRRVAVMLKRTKSANKSVIQDAIDNDNTAVTLAGPSQPDEDDYGYVSQEASAFYNKMMQKYSTMPEEEKFPKAKKNVNTNLKEIRDRVKAAIEREKEEALLPHRRKRKPKEKGEDDQNEYEKEEEIKQEEKPKPKPRPAPPPINFNELLKLAEKKQFEPIKIEPKIEPKDEERPLTKKQKKEYEKEKAWREKKERGDGSIRDSLRDGSERELPRPDKSGPSPNKIPKLSVPSNNGKIPKIVNPDDRKPQNSLSRPIPKKSDERPNLPRKPDERPSLPRRPDERSNLSRKPDERPNLPRRSDERPNIPRRPDERPNLSGRSDERPNLSRRPDERPNLSRKQDERSSLPRRPEERQNLPRRPDDRIPKKNDERPDERLPRKYDEKTSLPKKSEFKSNNVQNQSASSDRKSFTDKESKLRAELEKSRSLNKIPPKLNGSNKSLPPPKMSSNMEKNKTLVRRDMNGRDMKVKNSLSDRPKPSDLKPKQFPPADVRPKQFPPADVRPKQFPPADVRPKQFPPADLRPKQFPPSDVQRRPQGSKPRPPMGHKRRILDDDSEYDSEMDDFIDDGPEGEEDYSKYISEIFGYDKSRYRHIDDEDDNMESSFSQMMKEEFISSKLGLMEDLEDMRKEAEEKKRKAMMKKKMMRK